MFAPSNGGLPAHNSYNTIPIDQMSHLLSYALSAHISGGQYYGVPVCVLAKPDFCNLLTFRSPILTRLLLSTNKLAHLMSLWNTFKLCRSLSPLHTHLTTSHTLSSGIFFLLRLYCLSSDAKSPFSQNSIITLSVLDLSS